MGFLLNSAHWAASSFVKGAGVIILFQKIIFQIYLCKMVGELSRLCLHLSWGPESDFCSNLGFRFQFQFYHWGTVPPIDEPGFNQNAEKMDPMTKQCLRLL